MNDLQDSISVSWHISDVQAVRPDLTDDQAREVLSYAKRKHDAEIGINWDVLKSIANMKFPVS